MHPNFSYGGYRRDPAPRPCPTTEQVFASLRQAMNKAATEYGRKHMEV